MFSKCYFPLFTYGSFTFTTIHVKWIKRVIISDDEWFLLHSCGFSLFAARTDVNGSNEPSYCPKKLQPSDHLDQI